MEFWRKRIVLSTLFVLLFFSGSLTLNDAVKASPGGCRDWAGCFDAGINSCIPLPTSLPAVSSEYTGGYGYRIRSTNCGAKKCYWYFTCRCGPGLGAGVCTPGSIASGACSYDGKKGAEPDEVSAN